MNLPCHVIQEELNLVITEDNISNNKVEIPVNQLLGQVPTPRHHQLRGAYHHLLDDTGRLQGFQPLNIARIAKLPYFNV